MYPIRYICVLIIERSNENHMEQNSLKPIKSAKFDVSDYLDSEEMISAYINEVIKEGSAEDIKNAIGHIAKAIGMSKIAERTGLTRPSLYKAFSEDSKPQFTTVMRVLKAIGSEIEVKPAKQEV